MPTRTLVTRNIGQTIEIRDMDLGSPAQRAAAHVVKMRARHYARRPAALDALFPGLSAAAPTTLVAVAAHLVERETRSPRRWFGFGGEVSLLNARAALLLGRTQRRASRGDAPGSTSEGEPSAC